MNCILNWDFFFIDVQKRTSGNFFSPLGSGHAAFTTRIPRLTCPLEHIPQHLHRSRFSCLSPTLYVVTGRIACIVDSLGKIKCIRTRVQNTYFNNGRPFSTVPFCATRNPYTDCTLCMFWWTRHYRYCVQYT